jgi:hypothetical protein
MARSSHPPAFRVGIRAADRYEINALLGRGGMALVYDATDTQLGRRVALKRLQPQAEDERQRRNLELFEREFHALSQLAHPRVVEVYDFGIDQHGAYYTMELLGGGDLQKLAPLPWRRACAIARDVCSALSLLHSRRLVHRDVSPRNVRCTEDGLGKLIDFGALAPVGPTKLLVGTPPCCAPESVHLQGVDARTDLFSLGATLYYVLVGRHAFAVRQFGALPAAWRNGFARPSDLVPEIPEALDALVLDLLRLDPDARPLSAAEVIERLSAIDGEIPREELRSAEAYLSTPMLVGRQVALERVQRRVRRATGGRSRSVLCEGAPGAGRTRFLDACLLDATLSGYTVVRADADDAVSGDYGVTRAIARQLLEQLPEVALETARPNLDQLASVIPELARAAGLPAPAPCQESTAPIPRARLQEALNHWLSALSRRQTFILAVDDFHRIDEPSASLIALLERDSTQHELCLLISAEAGAAWTAQAARKLLQAETTIQLENLSFEDSEQLLRSLFGAAPNLGLLTHRLYGLSAGNPRDLLRLAHHLVDRRVARYAAGAWTLPAAIDDSDLPASLAQALAARIADLHEPARQLACAFALCPDQGFSLEECGALADMPDAAGLLGCIEALIRADIVRVLGERAQLSQRSWAPLLRATLSVEREHGLQCSLARAFERRSHHEFRAAQHWLRAGELSRALDLLLAHCQSHKDATTTGPEMFLAYLLSLPDGWDETLERAIEACKDFARPRRDKYRLQIHFVDMMSMLSTPASKHVAESVRQIGRDSGLDDWQGLPAEMDPKLRFETALALAQARYDATPEHDRVFAPLQAIEYLGHVVIAATGVVVMALDVAQLRALPPLAPFAPLSAALEASHMLVAGVDARFSGRFPRARRIYQELLVRLDRPDHGGLELGPAQWVRLGMCNGLGMLEAGLGLDSCLAWAEKVARNPAYEVNALIIRMLHCLFRGDVISAETCRQEADRLRIQNSGRQMYEGGHLIWEVLAHALAADLTRMRRVTEEIAPLAQRYPHWIPVLHWAAAEHYRIVRDPQRASIEIEKALALAPVGLHQVWANIASAQVLVSIELARYDVAVALADDYVAVSERELEYVPDRLQLARALARAYAGLSDAAPLAEAATEAMQQRGVRGLHLGFAHETRARIALLADDVNGFARHAELCRELYCAYKNTALTARYQRLVNDGRRSFYRATEPLVSTPDSAAHYSRSRLDLALASCRDEEQRARLSLTILIQQSGGDGGLSFALGPDGPVYVAQLGNASQSEALFAVVRAFIAEQTSGQHTTSTQSGVGDDAQNDRFVDPSGRDYRLVLLSHIENGETVMTGIVAIVAPASSSFHYPRETAAAISRYAAISGATSLLLLID